MPIEPASPAFPNAAAQLQVRSRRLAAIPHLAGLCEVERVLVPRPWRRSKASGFLDFLDEAPSPLDRLGATGDLPIYATFPSPIRLIALDNRHYPPLGLIFDHENARDELDGGFLADRIATGALPEALAKAGIIIARLRAVWARLGALRPPLALPERPVVLIEPQTRADRRWIRRATDIEALAEAALAQFGAGRLVLWGQSGPLDRAFQARGHHLPKIERDDPALLAGAAEVWTWGSRAGFEALIAGAPVTTFGAPFYAGWGLTQDRAPHWAQRGEATLETLVAATVLEGARYADPVTGAPVDALDALRRLEEWADIAVRHFFPRPVSALDIPRWKQPMIRAHLWCAQTHFARDPAAVPPGITDVALWSYPEPMPVMPPGIKPQFIEDGFLRSSGLGSDFHFPLSLAIDRRAMHFDATRPSDLEMLLSTHVFNAAELATARKLRDFIVTRGLTKYNLAEAATRVPSQANAILVAGQVPDDAAVRHGAYDVRTSAEMLREIRKQRPHSRIVFKEHPEIVAGNRPGRIDPSVLAELVDEDVTGGSILDAIAEAGEVHVISSLAGFEALLRGKKVVCWGRPFYAGWGLTEDMAPIDRRQRRLTLDELVAGALVLYARYVEPRFGIQCSALDIAALLEAARAEKPSVWSAPGSPLRHLGNAVRFLALIAGLDRRSYWLPG